MIRFARKVRGGTIEYVESSETKEIVFDAMGATAVGFTVGAAGIAGGIGGWVLSLLGFIMMRRAFSTHDLSVNEYPQHEAAHAEPSETEKK